MASCPYCNTEVQEGEKFCGHCGKKLLSSKIFTEENKYWIWGSMIASFVFLIIAWWIGLNSLEYNYQFIFVGWLIAFPLIIFLMYKERAKKIKYALAWISVVIVLLCIYWLAPLNYYYDNNNRLIASLLFSLAIFLDATYVYKLK